MEIWYKGFGGYGSGLKIVYLLCDGSQKGEFCHCILFEPFIYQSDCKS